jgi:predicted transcriptional regulator
MSDRPAAQSADDGDEVQYDPDSGRYDVYECTVADCDNVVLVVGSDDPPMACHDEPMERVTEVDMTVKPPDVRQVLLEAFGLPKAGLDICLCVIGEGPLSANEVAEELGYDRSTVTRYLNKLVELGLLRRSELNREGGGVVKVYHSVDLERMRRETLVGFYVWAGEAASLIEEANLTKQEYLDANPDRELPDVFWESFPDG